MSCYVEYDHPELSRPDDSLSLEDPPVVQTNAKRRAPFKPSDDHRACIITAYYEHNHKITDKVSRGKLAMQARRDVKQRMSE